MFEQFTTENSGYTTDWDNIAPNIGVAWRPQVESGWLRTILGDPEWATVRGGYSVAYERQGFAAFTGVFGPNPGSTLTLTRDANTGLVPPGESWPVLLRETNRLYPAPFPASPTYPIAVRANRADSISAFHPEIEIAFARTWTVGFQRSLTSNMAVEARYVGTRGVDQWSNARLQRDQHHRERLLQRVQAGDGELPGEQRRRRQPRQLVRLLRARHRHGAAADLSRLPRRGAPTPRTRARTPARSGRTPR